MRSIKSYITNPKYLNAEYLNFNIELAKQLDLGVNFIIHSKTTFEPSISPIIGSGLPDLQVAENDKLRSVLDDFIKSNKQASYQLSQDIFADVFNDNESKPHETLHTFSTLEADFILHNVYSDSSLDATFDHLSPALFIPQEYKYKQPKKLNILLFSEDIGSDFTSLIKLTASLGAKLNFIIQQKGGSDTNNSALEKIMEANHIDLADHKFSARFVDKITTKLLNEMAKEDESEAWTVFQHTFLIHDFKDKKLDLDMYELLSNSKGPMIIV
jgi:hypothetical protein